MKKETDNDLPRLGNGGLNSYTPSVNSKDNELKIHLHTHTHTYNEYRRTTWRQSNMTWDDVIVVGRQIVIQFTPKLTQINAGFPLKSLWAL